jgi:hypothetical protein
MVASSQTTASLAKCFGGELRKVVYPMMELWWTVSVNTGLCGC